MQRITITLDEDLAAELDGFMASTGANPPARARPPHVVLQVMESMGHHMNTHDRPGRDLLGALRPHWRRALDQALPRGPLRRGVGVASCWYGCGNTSLPNPSTIRIGVTHSGRLMLHQGATDIGQGSNTVIAQIAADALGVAVGVLVAVGLWRRR